MILSFFRSLFPLRDLLTPRLGSMVAAAQAQVDADPHCAAATLLRDVQAAPDDGRLPCLHHDGSACPECGGSGHHAAPTDAASWEVRARRARYWTERNLEGYAVRACAREAGHAWVRVVELTTGEARSQAIDNAVRDFNRAALPEEARLVVVKYAADAGEWALQNTGKVGRKIARRKDALQRLGEEQREGARLAPTLHYLGEVEDV